MTTSEENKKLIEDYSRAISIEKSEATLDKYIVDDELKGHIIIFEAGMPNYQLIAHDIIADGNKVAVRATVKGVHSGELFGIPPTGQKVSVDGIIIYEIADKKIVNHWMQFDNVAMMQQIGAMAVNDTRH